MKAQPIIMQPESVVALLEDRKGQTRRIVKPQPDFVPDCAIVWPSGNWQWRLMGGSEPACAPQFLCPYGKPGDLLWVRERMSNPRDGDTWTRRYHYDADNSPSPVFSDKDRPGPRPSIYMPRRASRLTLRLTDVRVQRVQEITADDALAEGIPPITNTAAWSQPIPDNLNLPAIYIGAFCKLWNSINAKRGYSWDANPWVWCLSFSVIHKNVDEVLRGEAEAVS